LVDHNNKITIIELDEEFEMKEKRSFWSHYIWYD
jgi:hypothetical protein